MLKIETIENRELWDKFLTMQDHSNILQSWAWGEFQKKLGRKIWRVGIFRNEDLVGVALAQYIPTRLRSHIYISNGPVIVKGFEDDGIIALVGYLKALAITEKAKFVRLDPIWEDNEINNGYLKAAKLQKATTHVQAEYKWILDITKDEKQLLEDMKKSTRYEIRKSEKEGIVVTSSSRIEDFYEFETLFQQTVNRQKFIPHPKEYYQTQFEVMTQSNNYKVVLAKKDNNIIAAALVGVFGDTSFYLHASSQNDKESNKLMAPQAIIWHCIKEGKLNGQKYFDFWGVAPTDDPKDPWAGFTRFKKGFGGYLFKTVRAYDLPISSEYFIISLLEKYREVWGGIYYNLKQILKK